MMQDDDDDDDDNNDPMILNNRAKNHTSERTILPWTFMFLIEFHKYTKYTITTNPNRKLMFKRADLSDPPNPLKAPFRELTAILTVAGLGLKGRATANRCAATILSHITTPRSCLCLRVEKM